MINVSFIWNRGSIFHILQKTIDLEIKLAIPAISTEDQGKPAIGRLFTPAGKRKKTPNERIRPDDFLTFRHPAPEGAFVIAPRSCHAETC
jgi:hypothetical protein